MNGIVIGNSQVGSLKNGVAALEKELALQFYSVPGGNGPKLKMKQGRVVAAGKAPPIAGPRALEETGVLLSEYDFIIYSGWGLSALRAQNPAHLLNLFTLAEMSCARPTGQQLVSRGFLAAAINAEVRRIAGTAALQMLRRGFDGPIIVQPFPLPTSGVLNREDCSLSEQYGADAGAFLSWYYTQQYKVLQEITEEIGGATILLPYPDSDWLAAGFTPDEYAQGGDCWHMNAAHGGVVLVQAKEALAMHSVA